MTAEQDTRSQDAVAPRGDGDGGRALPVMIAIAALLGLATTIVWGAASHGNGYYWPAWVWLGMGTFIALFAAGRQCARSEPGPRRWLVLQAWISAILSIHVIVTWALGGAGVFWPLWPMLGYGLLLGLHAVLYFQDRLPGGRTRQLTERVDVLTRTRRGALDVQAAELRRIERDLHDGAQARLVALSMQIGRAEARVEDQPEVAELLRAAREEAGAAIRELRDLARGIAPPVLADRGLEAAVESLAQRTPVEVTVWADLRRRPVPVVETAAYFVVAEALTNVAKHAPGAAARVTIHERHERLLVEVADDGPGGAQLPSAAEERAAGGSTGLAGLRNRVEALDGVLKVTSPEGVGTVVRAELPCGS